MADRYTIVAYDPRGNSRSTFDGEPAEQDMDVHGDDAARLIEAAGGGPAFVLGSSGGAQIGLNLAARHPQRVRKLVAHEPPCVLLLPDPAQARADTEAIYDTYKARGVGAAMQAFAAFAGLGGGPSRDDAPPAQAPPRIGGNMDYFLGHGVRPIALYRPDIEALRAGAARIVVGVGAASWGQVAHRTALALAERLGAEPTVFPGGHGGYGEDPAGFAVVLDRTLSGEARAA